MSEQFSTWPTQHWHRLDQDRVQCDICPRHCQLSEGQRGFCFVRANHQSQVVLTSYGRSSGFVIDPIEKKPLNHFLPGTPVLSFGTAGCNLSCKFCQNWDISKSRQMDRMQSWASPEAIALAAKQSGSRSVAYTYNDPVIFHEYAIDVAQACEQEGVKSVAVSAGFQDAQPRIEFYQHMDAANIDLKAFSERFYKKICGASLANVLETLQYLKQETQVWFEITTLLIPDENDSDQELHQMCQWIRENLGENVPIHFSAFHPDWKMQDKARTPHRTLTNARNIAKSHGLHYVYIGNVHDPEADSTWCHHCGELLIGRDWYQLSDWKLDKGACQNCGSLCAGVFEATPGKWGRRRQQIRIQN